MKSMILINSLERSGGTLLTRLLEGHKEIQVSPLTFCPIRFQPGGWPFYGLTTEQSAEEKLKILEKKLLTRSDGSFLGSDGFDKHKFKEMIEKIDSEKKAADKGSYGAREFLEIVNDSFFSLWQGGRYDLPSAKYYAFHGGNEFYLPADLFFNVYPDGYIIQQIRDPRAVVASRKHFIINKLFGYVNERKKIKLKPDTLKFEILKWLCGAICAFLNQKNNKNHYIVIRYEDLVTDVKAVMESLARRLGIIFDETLLCPTAAQRPWAGNTAYKFVEYKVHTKTLSKFKELLSDAEEKQIDEMVGSLDKFFYYPQCMAEKIDDILPLCYQIICKEQAVRFKQLQEFITQFNNGEPLKITEIIDKYFRDTRLPYQKLFIENWLQRNKQLFYGQFSRYYHRVRKKYRLPESAAFRNFIPFLRKGIFKTK